MFYMYSVCVINYANKDYYYYYYYYYCDAWSCRCSCIFIVSKALFISSATVIVRARGAMWLNPFATVLFTVCSAVTVEWCALYPYCVGVFGMLKGRRLFSSVFAITERRDMGQYKGHCLCLCWGLGWGLC